MSQGVASDLSFGLATWILTLVATSPGIAAAHYAARIVDTFVRLLRTSALTSLKNQRAQVSLSLALSLSC